MIEWDMNLMKRSGVKAGEHNEREWWLLSWIDKVKSFDLLCGFRVGKIRVGESNDLI